NYVRPEVALARKADGTFVNAQADTVRPYVGYTSILQQENNGVSSYNALQASFQKRMTAGFTGSVAYKFGNGINKLHTDTSDLPVPFSQPADKGLADSDRRHVLAISYVYEFPWFRSARGFSGHLLGGWQISGITTAQSGKHVSLSGGSRATTAPSTGF